MRNRGGRTLVLCLVVVGLLAGCATVARQEQTGLPNAENPEYFMNPFRLVALPLNAVGNLLQYTVAEPLYFAMNAMPDFVGLSLEEQRYITQRQEAWQRASAAQQVQPAK
jgi:hypothetical protein